MQLGKTLIYVFIALFIISPMAYAFGVSAEYDTNRKLQLLPGQSKEFKVYLQNMAGPKEDIKLRATVNSDENVAEVADSSNLYDVPFGRKDVIATIRVKVPEDAKLGTKYNINITFKQVSDTDNEMLKMTGAIKVNVPVYVENPEQQKPVAEPKSEQKLNFGSYMVIAVIVLVMGIVGYFLYKKKK